ncbi:MAG: FtsX-like permease family protein [Bacteroides sp.]|nr:FtsX-like permease family protein [Bacteroides sp.]
MKQIVRQIVGQLWSQRRSNAWLFIQLILVFVVMWFWVDLMWDYATTTFQSQGIEIEDVYEVDIRVNNTLWEDPDLSEKKEDYFRELIRQIGQYPDVEAVCYFDGTRVYEENFMTQGYANQQDTSAVCAAKIRYISPEYIDVFRVDLERGNADGGESVAYPRPALISGDMAEILFNGRDVVGMRFYDYYAHKYGRPEVAYYVSGILPPTKVNDYHVYEPFIYVYFDPVFFQWSVPTVALRVKPGTSSAFASDFIREMKSKLRIGPYYMIGIQSYKEKREVFSIEQGHTAYLQLSYGISLFFVCNVFFAVIGTFWFRTRKRRGEIGLRMAMGATRRQVQSQILFEALILFSLAALPAVVICLNMIYADVNVLALSPMTPARYIVTLLLTYLLIGLMVWLGSWYPARYAMKLEPAEALHEE